MRKLSIVFMTLLLMVSVAAFGKSESKACVDERFEFTSIVWRLAEAQEYSQCAVPVYKVAIDKYFEKYKKHALIKYCKEIRKDYGVAYDAIASAAAYIEIEDRRVRMREGFVAESIINVDKRWTPETFAKYVELLDKFYRKTKFDKFYASQKPIYDEAEKNFEDMVLHSSLGLDWFKGFFGEEPESYMIYLCINNGPSNYGGTNAPGYDVAAVMGCAYTTSKHYVTYSPSAMNIVLHEFMHTFANPIADKYVSETKVITEMIFPYIKEQLYSGAYDEGAIMYEWFTRLATIMYMKDAGNYRAVEMLITGDITAGFLWQRDAVEKMKEMEANREKYPTFESFVPELITFLESVADDMDKYMEQFVAPEVVDVSPEIGSVIDCEGMETLNITVKFSEPMSQGNMHINPISEYPDEVWIEMLKEMNEGVEAWSEGFKWVDSQTFVIDLPMKYMNELKLSGFLFVGSGFKSHNGMPMKEDVEVKYEMK